MLTGVKDVALCNGFNKDTLKTCLQCLYLNFCLVALERSNRQRSFCINQCPQSRDLQQQHVSVTCQNKNVNKHTHTHTPNFIAGVCLRFWHVTCCCCKSRGWGHWSMRKSVNGMHSGISHTELDMPWYIKHILTCYTLHSLDNHSIYLLHGISRNIEKNVDTTLDIICGVNK